MKALVFAILFSVSIVSAYAQSTSSSCEAKALSKNGKALQGAAKASFMKKCEREASADTQATCEAKAISKDGKQLSGAAKASSIKKCMGLN